MLCYFLRKSEPCRSDQAAVEPPVLRHDLVHGLIMALNCRAVVMGGAALDAHLADQVLIGMALAAGCSEVSVECVTRHLETNLDVIRTLLGVESVLTPGKQGWMLRLQGLAWEPQYQESL